MIKMVWKLINKFFAFWSFSLLGGFLIAIFVYLRINRVFLSRELYLNISKFEFFVFTAIMLVFLYLFSLEILAIFGYNKYNKFSLVLNNFVFKSLYSFYETLKEFFGKFIDISKLHENIGLFCVNYLNKPIIFKVTLFVFDILPKILIVFAFFIDILIFHKFNYFYKISIIIIIPLLLSFIIYTFISYYAKNIESVDSVLDIENIKKNTVISTKELFSDYCYDKHFKIENYSAGLTNEILVDFLNVAYDEDNSIYHYISLLLTNFFPILCFFEKLNYYKKSYSAYLNIVLYGFYFFGWAIVVYNYISFL